MKLPKTLVYYPNPKKVGRKNSISLVGTSVHYLMRTITPQVLKRTAKEDMQTIQPMIKAIRTNNLADMMKYEDIMINLDEVMLNHKRNTEIAGRIQEGFKERQNTIKYKKQDTIENLLVEVAVLGIFDRLKDNDIIKVVQKIVEENPLDTDFHQLKSDVIHQAIALNQQRKEQNQKQTSKDTNVLPLLSLREKALKKKQHPHDFWRQMVTFKIIWKNSTRPSICYLSLQTHIQMS